MTSYRDVPFRSGAGFSQSAMTERLSQMRDMVLDNVCMGLAGRAAEEVKSITAFLSVSAYVGHHCAAGWTRTLPSFTLPAGLLPLETSVFPSRLPPSTPISV